MYYVMTNFGHKLMFGDTRNTHNNAMNKNLNSTFLSFLCHQTMAYGQN